MEKEISTTLTAQIDGEVEMQHLVAIHNDLEQGGYHPTSGQTAYVKAGPKRHQDGIFHHHIERLNVKKLVRVWGPHLEFIVRLMLVSTFLDDSLRTVTQFAESSHQISEQGCLKWLTALLPGFVSFIATIALSIGLLAQSIGSLCLVALTQPDIATNALISWVIAQPVLFGQLSNLEYVAESVSIVGGLLMLRAHLVFDQARFGEGARIQLLGRLLLPVTYLYRAGQFLVSAFTLDETNNIATFFSSLSIFVVYSALLFSLVAGSILVAAGIKSRVVALLLGLVNLGFIFYHHPFFRYVWIEDGQWKYDEDNMTMPNVALPEEIGVIDFEPWQIYDLHRYYFFLGVSTSGALLLLAQFGPGEIAVQKDEIILPIRAQD